MAIAIMLIISHFIAFCKFCKLELQLLLMPFLLFQKKSFSITSFYAIIYTHLFKKDRQLTIYQMQKN